MDITDWESYGGLYNDSEDKCLHWEREIDAINLQGTFTIEDLEAIIAYMKKHKVSLEASR